MSRAEAVFNGAQNTELIAPVALKINHRIDHMLQNAGACNLAILGDMADQHQGGIIVFGKMNKLLSGDAHLADRAGGGLNGR